MPGALVVLEGIDQAGKMTQARALQSRLRAAGLTCEVRHYPDYDTPIGQLIRDALHRDTTLDARARCMLFAANRWEKDSELRALCASQTLVCVDRYTWSNVVYGLSQGLDEAWLCGLEAGLLEPDLTLLVDIAPEESRRRKGRGRDGYERDTALLDRARAHYRRVAGERGWVVLDGAAPAEDVTLAALGAIVTRLGERVGSLRRLMV